MVLYLKILLLNLILTAEEVVTALEYEAQSASDDGYEALDSDSFNIIGVDAAEVKECFGPGSGVDEGGQCFCDDSVHAMTDPTDADNCICKPYHLLNDAGNGCIMCAGPGAFIKDEACSCHASQNAVQVRSVFKLTSD